MPQVPEQRKSMHGNWSSRLAFILAVTGSAVGLGNIWKFPYIAGENGGGAFVLAYLMCIVIVGMPIMMSEIMLGRRGGRNPASSMAILGREEGSSGAWTLIGVSGILGGVLILSYYSVIAGIALAYIIEAFKGAFVDQDPQGIQKIYDDLTGDWKMLAFWHTLFVAFTVFVVGRGIKGGLEKAVQFMVPALLAIMIILLGYAMTSGSFGAGLAFMFTPDFGKLSGESVLKAMGLAFFSLSAGMGALLAYGSYLPRETSIPRAAAAVVAADTSIALLAGMVIFPIVYANGLSPAAGEGLVFQTLPNAFGAMNGGVFMGTLFFVLLSFAAWTSAIALLEPAVAWLVETTKWPRRRAATALGVLIWIAGFGTVFSYNVLSGDDAKLFGMTIFENLDYLTSNIMLPVGGLFIAIFAGWVMRRSSSADELGEGLGYTLWRFSARYIAPVAIVLVIADVVGVIDVLTG
ncbi:MAG: sodium-dependent transporter [Pseudomonadota bacterium]